MANVVEMYHIFKSFGPVQALQNVNLSLGYGEVLGLVGDNAAGKSTLMKVLTGAYLPDSGTLRFDGAEVHWASPHESRLAGIEMVYQDFALAGNLDICANIFLDARLRSLRSWAGACACWTKSTWKFKPAISWSGSKSKFDRCGSRSRTCPAGSDRPSPSRARRRSRPKSSSWMSQRSAGRQRSLQGARNHPRVEGAQHRRHHHQPPPARYLSGVRPHHGFAAGPQRRRPAGAANDHGRDRGDDGRR